MSLCPTSGPRLTIPPPRWCGRCGARWLVAGRGLEVEQEPVPLERRVGAGRGDGDGRGVPVAGVRGRGSRAGEDERAERGHGERLQRGVHVVTWEEQRGEGREAIYDGE